MLFFGSARCSHQNQDCDKRPLRLLDQNEKNRKDHEKTDNQDTAEQPDWGCSSGQEKSKSMDKVLEYQRYNAKPTNHL